MMKVNFTRIGDRFEGSVWSMSENQMSDTIVIKTEDRIGLVVATYKKNSNMYKVLVGKIFMEGDLDNYFSRAVLGDFDWVDDGEPDDMVIQSEFSLAVSLVDFHKYTSGVYSEVKSNVSPTVASAVMSSNERIGDRVLITSTLASEYLKIKSPTLIRILTLDKLIGFKEYIANNMSRMIREGY